MRQTRRKHSLHVAIHRRVKPIANSLHAAASTRKQKRHIRHRERTFKRTLGRLLKGIPPEVATRVLNTLADEDIILELVDLAVV